MSRIVNAFVAGLLVLVLVWASADLGGTVIAGAVIGAALMANLAFVIGPDRPRGDQ